MDEVKMPTGGTHWLACRGSQRAVSVWLTLLSVCACWVERPASSAEVVSEYDVEAAYLFNFTKFVQWPRSAFPSDTSAFGICIVGDHDFSKALDEIVKGEEVAGHKIVVETPQTVNDKSCQVAYFDNEQHSVDLVAIGNGVLTVGAGDAFLRRGGMIAFVVEDRRVRFDVNLKAATDGGLKLSSKLLSVARYVEK